jgi:hypothetical protein
LNGNRIFLADVFDTSEKVFSGYLRPHQKKEALMNTTTFGPSYISDPGAIPAKTVSSRCPYVYPNGERCSLPGLPDHSGNCLRHSHANSLIALPVQSDSEDLSA